MTASDIKRIDRETRSLQGQINTLSNQITGLDNKVARLQKDKKNK